jgi:hypothetical protein
LRKIRIAVDLLHEDLQHDYLQEIDALKIWKLAELVSQSKKKRLP